MGLIRSKNNRTYFNGMYAMEINKMNEYHKIQTVFERDPDNNYKTLLNGEYARQEFEYLKANEWVFTEKIDGTNIRIMFDGERITFGGRTNRAQIPTLLVTRLNDLFLSQSDLFRDRFPDGVCLYGEGYGAKIQNGSKYRDQQDFVLFDVRVGDWWLLRQDIEQVASLLGVDVVPVIGSGTLSDMVDLARTGFNSVWGEFVAEGIVARPEIELSGRDGSRIITKIKHTDFSG